MEPHQQALVDQAIRHILTRYDDQQGLLRSTEDARFRSVKESLAFAALLLARTAAGKGRKTELGLARLVIDNVLSLQNRTRRDPGRGAFPLVWTPDTNRAQIMDADSREAIGSLLGLMLKDYQQLLGDRRVHKIRDAIQLAIRDKEQSQPETTAGAMMAAWLELEFGDEWRGERLATDVALAGQDELSARRFGNPEAYARELWALSLWRRSSRLHDSVEVLLHNLLAEVGRYAHPGLPEVFGAVTTSAGTVSQYPWLGTWLTWHALAGEPMMPKQMGDPLQSALFAYPALGRLKFSDELRQAATASFEPHALCEEQRSRTISGWWEGDLHIEARSSRAAEGGRLPVAGARWRTPQGGTVWMRARVTKRESAVCRKRFIYLDDPGTTTVTVHNMGPGETRMIENGWWLSGLHFATEGFQMLDAERSDGGLTLRLKPTAEQPMLMFSPLR